MNRSADGAQSGLGRDRQGEFADHVAGMLGHQGGSQNSIRALFEVHA